MLAHRELVIGFILGIISSAAVGWYIYARQKKESQATEQKLVTLIHQQLDETGKVASTIMAVQDVQENMLKGVESLRNALTDQIPDRKVLQLSSAVAAAVAQTRLTPTLQRAPKTDSLSVETIQHLHDQLFAQTARSGGYRSVNVWIGSKDSKPENARYTPPSPEAIAKLLQDLTREWVETYPALKHASTDKQLEAVVRFHHRFVSIHPFLDGNGIVGRLLLAMQWRDLTGTKREIIFNKPDYYSALQEADRGDYSSLTALVRSSLAS